MVPPFRPLHQHEIRTIRLQPANGNDTISCEIEYLSLRSDPEYLALSYACGDVDRKQTITVSGHDFEIPQNLNVALLQLRKSLPSLLNRVMLPLLWVDAISIDQDDLDEKARQIRLMDKIYTNASTVFIWLGPNPDESDNFLRIVFKLASVMSRIGQALMGVNEPLRNLFNIFHTLSPWQVFEPFMADHISHEQFLTTVRDLLHRPWFSRVWTIQEAVLPITTPIVLAGDHSVTLWALLSFLKVVKPTGQHVTVPNFREFETPTVDALRLRLWQERYRAYHSTFSLIPERKIEPSFRTFARELHSVLVQNDRCKCSDPRDYIFGVLGLTVVPANPSLPTELEVNYQVPFQRLFHYYAMFLFKHTGKLSLLCFTFQRAFPDLPNWVPDFRNLEAQVVGVSKVDGKITFSEDCMKMYAQGVEIGKIQSTMDGPTSVPGAMDLVKLARLVKSFHEKIIEVSSHYGKNSVSVAQDAWLQWVSTGPHLRNDNPTWGPFQQVKDCYMVLVRFPDEKVSVLLEHMFMGNVSCVKIEAALVGLCHFVLEDGTIGRGNICSEPQAGDIVCALKGAYAPVLLRSNGETCDFVGAIGLNGHGEKETMYDDDFFSTRPCKDWIIT